MSGFMISVTNYEMLMCSYVRMTRWDEKMNSYKLVLVYDNIASGHPEIRSRI